MKSILPQWYSPDDEAIQKILETGTIAFDTNVLLDLYRVGREQREEILSVLRDSRDRLFVPYQVCFEFLRRRLDVISGIDAVYGEILESVQVNQAQLNKIRDPEVRRRIEQLSNRANKSFANGLDKLREEHTISFREARENDPVQRALDELLGPEQLGVEPSEDELAKRRAEAARRGDEKIPPGFADKKEKDDASGDYLIWAELLDHAGQSDRPLLFVTNDEGKGDWYREVRGQTIGPCTELIVEMRGVTEHSYHQTNLSSFLFLAKTYLDAKVDDETITTVKNIPRAKTPPPQDISERVASVASALAATQDQNLGIGLLGDKLASISAGLRGDNYPGINAGLLGDNYPTIVAGLLGGTFPGITAQLLGEDYFTKHGIEQPLASIGASIAANHPGTSIVPPGMSSAVEALGGRAFLDSLYRSVSPAGSYGVGAADKSAPADAPAAKKALPTMEAAKKTPAKKVAAKKTPAKKVAAKKASSAVKASEGKKAPRAK
ncbi:PIN domain-containing protein [Mycobacterium rhizamassiliense]|uniref:PIN domain-containing protein n=1 Tax=Mycobacterium rhizamassiliense TaxID=1841860 RepID=UPI0012FF77BE|nr:PIN domain-containing protein [Mycobacterium rhizamassiliense]